MSKTELLDIGEHCSFCGQIDFLPFKCSCKQTFCMLHKSPESHQCVNLKLSTTSGTTTISSPKQGKSGARSTSPNSFEGMPSSQSLFPDRSNPIQIKFKTTETNPITIQGSSKKSLSALGKLKKFFMSSNGKSKKVTTTSNATKRIIEASKLKSSAKGDTRVPASERIYLNVLILNDSADSTTKNPVYVSRTWPVGRALDSIADTLKVKNINNRTTDVNEKLFLFKLKGNGNGEAEFIKVATSDRVNKSFVDGDEVYLVRGTDV